MSLIPASHRREIFALTQANRIRKAYRRKALSLHPDRNYGDVENATRLFAAVQAAYEVLSDPQERAWYDAHRDTILRDQSEDGLARGEHHDEHHMRITTAEEITRMFGKFHGGIDFSDAPHGFYGVLRATFAQLAKEEHTSCYGLGILGIHYPSFGGPLDAHDEVVRPFYAAWNGFATKKTYAWKDRYRLSEAPDRRVRRLMERENRKLRDEGIREFNDAVRSMVAFVRKRDPRHIANAQSEVERQRSLKEAATAQAARSRAENHARIMKEHIVPEWTKTKDPFEITGVENSEGDEVEEDEGLRELYECVVCGKTFRSEKQFEAHEKSKKHQKLVYSLQKKIQKENRALGLEDLRYDRSVTTDDDLGTTASAVQEHYEHKTPDTAPNDANESRRPSSTESGASGLKSSQGQSNPDNAPDLSQISDDVSNDEYAPRDTVEARILESMAPATTAIAIQEIEEIHPLGQKKPGKKARDKRAKRAAIAASASGTSQVSIGGIEVKPHICGVCNDSFPSRTMLFCHLKETGHAVRTPANQSAKRQGKDKKS